MITDAVNRKVVKVESPPRVNRFRLVLSCGHDLYVARWKAPPQWIRCIKCPLPPQTLPLF